MKKQPAKIAIQGYAMQEEEEENPNQFTDKSDICEQLLNRYGKSTASQHRHLCATAAATRSIIQSESLPLNPLSYFAATIDALSNTSSKKSRDSDAVSALSSFLSIVLPLVPEKSILPSKATEAVGILLELVGEKKPNEAFSCSSVRALVKGLGVLVEFCDLDDWESVQSGFHTLLKFSLDKRPKVRKCAQDCVVKIFKLFPSSLVKKRAGKMVFTLFKSYMPLAVKLSASQSVNGSKEDILSKSAHLEVLHMLNVLKHLTPYLPVKVRLKIFVELQKLVTSKFSALTRHIFEVMEETFQCMQDDATIPVATNMVEVLTSYISTRDNPVDTILSSVNLLEIFLKRFYVGEPNKESSHFTSVIGSISGLLAFEATVSRASDILKELINLHIDGEVLLSTKMELTDDEDSSDLRVVKYLCDVLLNVLSSCSGIPNEHILAVISLLFVKLGEISHIYMKAIICKLGTFMSITPRSTSETKQLEECIGSAVVAMGPEKLLTLLPVYLNANELTCSNILLVPILKNYVSGSSLGFFMEHIMPLAESFEQASKKVEKPVLGQDLQAHAHGCWGLLPAFCRYPTDTSQNFGSLAKLLISFLRKDSFMIENVAIALQQLVKQNRSVLESAQGDSDVSRSLKKSDIGDPAIKIESKPAYTKKTATRNIRAIASCSEELLQALNNVLFESPVEKHGHLKDTIGCVASITDSSVIKKMFISSLEGFDLMEDDAECGMLDVSLENEKDCPSSIEKREKRGLILELASSIVGSASEDLIDMIFIFVKQSLQEKDESIESEAYLTLTKVLEESCWWRSSKLVELVDLLLGLSSPVNPSLLRYRFACFRTLLVHGVEGTLDEENTNPFRMLNEIILALKDCKEEGRKVASDALLSMCSSLQRSSSLTPDGPYHKFLSMLMGYLSGSSPHIKSGAVSALSIAMYNDSNICCLLPNLVPSVLELLHSKSIEVIKAVLGFVKVMVLSLDVKDLQNALSDIVNGVLKWSSVSRYHFRVKVSVILEIVIRRCGCASVKSITPAKHWDFVTSVLEHRESRKHSKKAVTTEIDPKVSDSTLTGQKRKQKDFGNFIKEEDSAHTRKRKRWDKQLSGFHSSNRPHSAASGNGVHRREGKHSGRDGLIKHGGNRTNNQNFNSDDSGGKGKKGWRKGRKKIAANVT